MLYRSLRSVVVVMVLLCLSSFCSENPQEYPAHLQQPHHIVNEAVAQSHSLSRLAYDATLADEVMDALKGLASPVDLLLHAHSSTYNVSDTCGNQTRLLLEAMSGVIPDGDQWAVRSKSHCL